MGYIDAGFVVDNEEEEVNLELIDKHSAPPHSPIFIGKVTLRSLSAFLRENGFNAEPRNKKITINNEVVLTHSRNDEGKEVIYLEGNLCETYFKVRKLLYSRYHIV